MDKFQNDDPTNSTRKLTEETEECESKFIEEKNDSEGNEIRIDFRIHMLIRKFYAHFTETERAVFLSAVFLSVCLLSKLCFPYFFVMVL